VGAQVRGCDLTGPYRRLSRSQIDSAGIFLCEKEAVPATACAWERLRAAGQRAQAGAGIGLTALAPPPTLHPAEPAWAAGISLVSIEVLLTSLIVVVSPGTGVLYTLGAGLSRGARASILAAFACTLGIIPHMLAAITGLAALLHTSALAFQTLKYLGVAYLLYMAWNTLQEQGALKIEKDIEPRSARQVIVFGILMNILNPKLSIFFFAFLPQFVSTGDPHALPLMLELSSIFMLLTFVVFAGYGVFAASVRSHIISRPKVLMWMRRSFAGAFAALGIKLALAER
jgi:threonine/homoserine/homoserine lactone efflux protein